jgi:N-carbamoylputrescine amidase
VKPFVTGTGARMKRSQPKKTDQEPTARRPRKSSAAARGGTGKSNLVTVGLIQTHCSPDPKDNLARTVQLVEEAANRGAQIICTQELFRSQYFCQSEDHANFALAEPIPGPSTDAFRAVARKRGVVIVASLFEKRAAGLYHNTAAVIDADGQLLGVYRKMHIPDDPLYYEKFYFAPGDLGFRAWSTRFGRIGVLVCWDQWYPEAARLTAMQGAEILFYPTAIGWHPTEKEQHGKTQQEAWETIQRGHAIANGCFVAVPNRVGLEQPVGGDGLQFWGQSFVAGTSGEILAKAAPDREEIVLAELDLGKVDVTRTHWPFFRDRRIDAYSDLTKRLSDTPL